MKAELKILSKNFPVTFKVDKYICGDSLCLSLIDHSEGYPVPFCKLTVSLGLVPDVDMSDSAFIDTNNCPWAEKFIVDLGIAVPSGIVQQSGFCVYPLYYFNLEEIKKYVEE